MLSSKCTSCTRYSTGWLRQCERRGPLQEYGAGAAANLSHHVAWTSTKPLWAWHPDRAKKRVVRRQPESAPGDVSSPVHVVQPLAVQAHTLITSLTSQAGAGPDVRETFCMCQLSQLLSALFPELCRLWAHRADRLASHAGMAAGQQPPQSEQPHMPALHEDEEMAEAAAAAGAGPDQAVTADQQQTVPLQHEEEDDMEIDIMGVEEGGGAAQSVPAAGPRSPQHSPTAAGVATQLDVYDFGNEALGKGLSALPCPIVQPSGLPNGHAAQPAQQEHACACSGAPAPKQDPHMPSAAAHTAETAAQPGAQPDHVISSAKVSPNARTAKRSGSVLGGEAESASPHKAAKIIINVAPRQALKADDSGLSNALLTEFAARAGNLWRDVSSPPG